MTAHSDVVLSGPDRPLVPAAPPDAASVAAPLLDALEQFRQRKPGRYNIRHFENCANAPGRMLAEERGQVPCSARCLEARRAVALAGGAG
jgi:hypothetical protein